MGKNEWNVFIEKKSVEEGDLIRPRKCSIGFQNFVHFLSESRGVLRQTASRNFVNLCQTPSGMAPWPRDVLSVCHVYISAQVLLCFQNLRIMSEARVIAAISQLFAVPTPGLYLGWDPLTNQTIILFRNNFPSRVIDCSYFFVIPIFFRFFILSKMRIKRLNRIVWNKFVWIFIYFYSKSRFLRNCSFIRNQFQRKLEVKVL